MNLLRLWLAIRRLVEPAMVLHAQSGGRNLHRTEGLVRQGRDPGAAVGTGNRLHDGQNELGAGA